MARNIESLESRDLLSADPWQNPVNHLDVNGDGRVTPADALAIIDALNNGVQTLPAVAGGSTASSGSPTPAASSPGGATITPQALGYLDVEGTGVLTPQDALAVIDQLNTGTVMTISLETVDALGNPIASVAVGSTFYLQALVQDTRGGSATGVESAYSDVTFNNADVTIASNAFTYPSEFPSDQQGSVSGGVIKQVGAAATTAPAAPAATEELWSVPVTATAIGALNFINGPDANDASTMFGSAAAVSTSNINYLSTSISIVPVALPTLSVGNASVPEPTTSGAAINFTVTLSAASANTVTVGYATASNTAVAGADYTSEGGTLTFQPGGALSQVVSVPILANPSFNGTDRNFFFDLTSPTNATVLTAQGTGTISAKLPNLSIDDATVVEDGTNPSDQSAVFTVSMSPVSSQPVTVTYETQDQTAVAGTDYTPPTNETVTIPAGQTSATITVPILQTIPAGATGSKTFLVNLESATGANVGAGQGKATLYPPNSQTNSNQLAAISVKITDLSGNPIDPAIGLKIGDQFLAEIDVQDIDPNLDPSNSGVDFAYTDLSWTAGLAEVTPDPAEVAPSPIDTFLGNFQAPSNSEHDGNISVSNTITDIGASLNYLPSTAPGSPNPPPGPGLQQLVTIQMTVTGIGSITFTPSPADDPGGDVGLCSPSPVTSALTDPQIDDIPSATIPTGNNGFSITGPAGGTVDNVTSGTTTATFTVNRTLPDATAITVPVSTQDGPAGPSGAVAGVDYEALPPGYTVSFAANQTTATVPVTIIGNSLNEPDKSFSVVLGTPTPEGALIPDKGVATVTIVSNPATEPIISVASATGPEGEPLQFVVSLVNMAGQPLQSGQTVTVNYATGPAAAGNAAPAKDYTSATGTLTFLPGQTQQIVSVDTAFDKDNTNSTGLVFQLNLSDATNATFPGLPSTSTSSAIGTITPIQPTSISGYVYVDTNNDGMFESSSETGIAGVTVTLTDTTTGVTNAANGNGGSVSPSVSSIALTSGGSGYTAAPVVAISGGGGAGATAIAEINANGVVTSILVTGGGSDYTSAPTVSLTGGGGSGAAATADTGVSITTIAGVVASATVTNGGAGYTSAPAVILSGGGTGATAIAKINASGFVTSITITNAGAGYTSPPTVTLTGGGGTNAAATAVLSGLGSYEFIGLKAGDTYAVTKTNPGFFVDGAKVVSVATPAPTGVVTPDEYSGIALPAVGSAAQNFNFPELGLRAEFISSFLNRRAFLSSSIITGEYGPTSVSSSLNFNLQGGPVWISYDTGWEGTRTFTTTFNPSLGGVTLQLFDNNLNALTPPMSGQLTYNGVVGGPYFLEITGSNPNVELSSSGGTTVGVAVGVGTSSEAGVGAAVVPAVVVPAAVVPAAVVPAVSAATLPAPAVSTAASTGTASQTAVAVIASAQTTTAKKATDAVLAQDTNWLSTSLFA